MRRVLSALFCLILSGWLSGAGAQAQTRVEVLETWPAGSELTLARNQNFYLRLAYSSDEPIGIWARPYFQGEPANAGSNPSLTYRGSGEALGWFFLMEPGARVDEIRISAGSAAQPAILTTLQVNIVGGSAPPVDAAEPTWVQEMRVKAELAQKQAYDERMNTPTSAADLALFSGFMMSVLALGIAALLLPVWACLRWRGRWRMAAAIPLAIIGFTILRIVIGVAADPTSHNLWPFEILQAGALAVVVLAGLAIARRFSSRPELA